MNAPPGACDVLVVGLGPVGLLLTALLRRHGCDVVAVDLGAQAADEPRAAALDDEALRALQGAGADQAVLGAGIVQEQAELRLRDGSAVTLMRMPALTSNGQPGLIGLHQPLLEARLTAEVAGAALRGIEVTSLVAHEHAVTVGAGDGHAIEAKWVVGCDGARSTVRRLTGVPFGGTTFAQPWLVVDAVVDAPGPPRVTFTGDPAAPAVTLPLTPTLRRWEVMVGPGGAPPPDALTGGAEPLRSAVYTFHARTAAMWRIGRVLLAGDAAHVMPPFAGQGLGSGLRDAANLAWKLAAVVRGDASEQLLDTYEEERAPHVLQMSALARFVGAIVQTRRGRLASTRDAALHALDGTALAARLQAGGAKPRARLRRGAIARGTPGAGALFPQSGRSDDVLGPGWALVSTEPVVRDDANVVVLGRDVEDESGRLARWLAHHGAAAALVRPDRHVYATGPKARDVPVPQL